MERMENERLLEVLYFIFHFKYVAVVQEGHIEM